MLIQTNFDLGKILVTIKIQIVQTQKNPQKLQIKHKFEKCPPETILICHFIRPYLVSLLPYKERFECSFFITIWHFQNYFSFQIINLFSRIKKIRNSNKKVHQLLVLNHGRLYRWTENSFPFFLYLKLVEISKKCFNIIWTSLKVV